MAEYANRQSGQVENLATLRVRLPPRPLRAGQPRPYRGGPSTAGGKDRRGLRADCRPRPSTARPRKRSRCPATTSGSHPGEGGSTPSGITWFSRRRQRRPAPRSASVSAARLRGREEGRVQLPGGPLKDASGSLASVSYAGWRSTLRGISNSPSAAAGPETPRNIPHFMALRRATGGARHFLPLRRVEACGSPQAPVISAPPS